MSRRFRHFDGRRCHKYPIPSISSPCPEPCSEPAFSAASPSLFPLLSPSWPRTNRPSSPPPSQGIPGHCTCTLPHGFISTTKRDSAGNRYLVTTEIVRKVHGHYVRFSQDKHHAGDQSDRTSKADRKRLITCLNETNVALCQGRYEVRPGRRGCERCWRLITTMRESYIFLSIEPLDASYASEVLTCRSTLKQ